MNFDIQCEVVVNFNCIITGFAVWSKCPDFGERIPRGFYDNSISISEGLTSMCKVGVIVVLVALGMLLAADLGGLSAQTTDTDIERRFNELRREYLEDRAESIDWWLTGVTVIIGFFAIIIAVYGYFGHRAFEKLKAEAMQYVAEVKRHVADAKRYADEMRQRLVIAREVGAEIEGIREKASAEEFDNNEELEKALLELLQTPNLSFIDKAIADAYTLQRDGKINQAIEKWRSIANIAEGMDEVLAARAWFSAGYLLATKEMWEKAIAAYDKAIDLNQDGNASPYNNRGAAQFELGRYQAAINDFAEAIRLRPDLVDAYYNQGTAWLALDEFDRAVSCFDEVIRLKPDYMAHNQRGTAKSKLGQYKAALNDFDKAIKLNPDEAGLFSNRGMMELELGEHEAAFADFDRAIQLQPDLADAYYNQGIARLDLGKHSDAVSSFDEVIRLRPDVTGAYLNRGEAKVGLDRIEEAKSDFRKALELAEQQEAGNLVVAIEERLQDLNEME